MLTTGLIGSVLAALCCFTPVLVLMLGALGLTAWAGQLDDFLLPILVAFLGITAYGLWRRRRSAACCAIEKPAHNPRD
ncbi:MAG: mercury resistance system transport protein MerF [Alphaproteobacteria bacterium]|nr:mercury resistance system transport protein MerF [Alphaproteobacteria bacterium]